MELYACVLELLAKSTNLSSNTAVQFCRAVFDPKKPSEMLSELQSLEQDLATASQKCEITAHARQEAEFKEYLQEAEDCLHIISRNMEQVLQWASEQQRRDLLQWISTIQYGRHHDEIEERRRPDTGDWLIKHEKFREWIDSPSSSVLWLQGSREFYYPHIQRTAQLRECSWYWEDLFDFSGSHAYWDHDGLSNGRVCLFLLQSGREGSTRGAASASMLSSPACRTKTQHTLR